MPVFMYKGIKGKQEISGEIEANDADTLRSSDAEATAHLGQTFLFHVSAY